MLLSGWHLSNASITINNTAAGRCAVFESGSRISFSN